MPLDKIKKFDPLPRAKVAPNYQAFISKEILAKWSPDIHAVQAEDDSSVFNIYDVIGEDWWTGGGITGKAVSAFLKKNANKEVTININSPGGDIFEGFAIYNLLKEHKAGVNINVISLAASAASVILMAGKNIKVAAAGYIMIHNSWSVCVGNKSEMRENADTLEKFDATMAMIYAKKSGISQDEIAAMMDDTTFLTGQEAVEKGFATALLDSDELEVDKSSKASYNAALKEVDLVLAKAGKSRSERRTLIKNLTSTPCAGVEPVSTPCAGDEKEENLVKAMNAFMQTLTRK